MSNAKVPVFGTAEPFLFRPLPMAFAAAMPARATACRWHRAKLPGKNGEMQRDYWYSSMRNGADLASPGP